MCLCECVAADLPVIEAAVDDRVVHGGAHSQPHDSEVNLLDERFFEHVRKELVQQEVDMEGKPADSKCAHNYDHHLHHLLTSQFGQTSQYSEPVIEGIKTCLVPK